jgi:hypothetical protein
MNDQPYSNREIDQLHTNLVERMVAHNDRTMEKLDTIETQVKKTNGRVNVLEKAMWIAMGAIGVLSLSEVRGIISAMFG